MLVEPDALGDLQIGYGVDEDGGDLTGDGPGDWRAGWIVIGTDEDLDDPFFVDLGEPELPVFTAMHGAGTWEPQPVAPSLEQLLASA